MLTLQYHAQTTVPVEIEGLVPNVVKAQSLSEIERFPIYHGNQQLPLAELFRVSGGPGDGEMRFEGELAGVHWIGAGMTEGRIHVAGPAGRHVGSEMSGGEIHVAGDAGDWVGGEMHGGLIHVRGRAGHLIGAAYRGSRRGMTGGTLLIGGDVGNEIGHTMRRGLLVVGGAAGDCPGFNMIAGTIIVLGDCGIRAGAGMRRGTLALLGRETTKLLPTFRKGAVYQPLFLRLIWRELDHHGFAFDRELIEAELQFFAGDYVAEGKGEVLMRS